MLAFWLGGDRLSARFQDLPGSLGQSGLFDQVGEFHETNRRNINGMSFR